MKFAKNASSKAKYWKSVFILWIYKIFSSKNYHTGDMCNKKVIVLSKIIFKSEV